MEIISDGLLLFLLLFEVDVFSLFVSIFKPIAVGTVVGSSGQYNNQKGSK
jgi:hypothetical protein